MEAFAGQDRKSKVSIRFFEASWGCLGAVLGASWGRLGAWDAVLGSLGAVLGRLDCPKNDPKINRFLEASWAQMFGGSFVDL